MQELVYHVNGGGQTPHSDIQPTQSNKTLATGGGGQRDWPLELQKMRFPPGKTKGRSHVYGIMRVRFNLLG